MSQYSRVCETIKEWEARQGMESGKAEEIARLKAELAEAQYDGRNARGLRLLLKPGEWRRRIGGDEADTSELGQDVAMLVILMWRQWREMEELRWKVAEWAERVDNLDSGYSEDMEIAEEMRDEVNK